MAQIFFVSKKRLFGYILVNFPNYLNKLWLNYMNRMSCEKYAKMLIQLWRICFVKCLLQTWSCWFCLFLIFAFFEDLIYAIHCKFLSCTFRIISLNHCCVSFKALWYKGTGLRVGSCVYFNYGTINCRQTAKKTKIIPFYFLDFLNFLKGKNEYYFLDFLNFFKGKNEYSPYPDKNLFQTNLN